MKSSLEVDPKNEQAMSVGNDDRVDFDVIFT